MALLEVKDIRKSFGKAQILKGISFDLEKGEVLSIIGSSGSGKTTLLRCLNYLEIPDTGSIKVGGKTVFDADSESKFTDKMIRDLRLHFGLVFQSFNLFPQYTALDNIMLAPKLRAAEEAKEKKLSSAEKKETLEKIKEKSLKLLDTVGLSDKAGHYPCQLSGGQQQRIAIARALCLDPDILCFDEPTSALDPELTGEVLRVIQELAAKNTTMIIVTHEMSFARDVSDQVIFMDDGVICEQGSPSMIFSNPQKQRTKDFLAMSEY
ncbi:MAG: amino acid ABC transporter ATP-binding protein [Ruminococcaceae bacterium]|nr:amino acid ABC transporter ATP-binding protein [Oscillospiraceae bacterium]